MFIRRKKGGKLEDKWLGPYSVSKVNPTNVSIYRNKKTQRVKTSKAKLWRKRPLIDHDLPTCKHLCLDSDFEIESEEEKLVLSPFMGLEETIFDKPDLPETSREEVLRVIFSFKSRIMDSIKTSTPLSKLHAKLHCRRHLPFRDIIDWRQHQYPSITSVINELIDFDTSQEICDVLAQFYLESHEIKIPEYQHTTLDFEFSHKWAKDSIDYPTNVLFPVVMELIAEHLIHDELSQSTLPQPLPRSPTDKPLESTILQTIPFSSISNHPIEDLCVTWGGKFNGVQLINTCSIDNFFTLLSLHRRLILAALNLAGEIPNKKIQFIFSMIKFRQNFDELRHWTAPELGIPLFDCKYNFLGYEGKMVKFFQDNSLSLDIYKHSGLFGPFIGSWYFLSR